MNDDLGNRMKSYEECFEGKLPRRMPMIVRVDGKTFHTLTKKWKCSKPYDYGLHLAMQNTMIELCKFISGSVLGYTQSDEISIVVRDDMTNNTQPFMDKRIQKLCSVIASKASTVFNADYAMDTKFIASPECYQFTPAMFDCRVFVLPENEVQNYMVWRQQDATRNSIQMLAQSLYSQKQLHGKKNAELQEMCFQKGHNWDKCQVWEKRGVCAIRKEVEKERDGVKFTRNVWEIDEEIPMFTKDKIYVEMKIL